MSIFDLPSDGSSMSTENVEFLGPMSYPRPKGAKDDDAYVSFINIYIKSDLCIHEPGIECELFGALTLEECGGKLISKTGYSTHMINRAKIDLDNRSILHNLGGGSYKKIDAVNVDQVIEDIECLLIG